MLANQPLPWQKPVTVFKGGTAFNSILREFQAYFPYTTYIVPITDDGGSSREISRVFGGPSIGDLRSTLTRLADENSVATCAVKRLLEHRLPCEDLEQALTEWHAFLEGNHPLYVDISSQYQELIRSFLYKFEAERLSQLSLHFDLRNGSIGNLFFSGIRIAMESLATAIFIYASVARIPATAQVLPILNSNDRLGIGVKLQNGDVILGQHMISHPTDHGHVDKNTLIPLPSPITELFYMDSMHHYIQPKPYDEVIHQIKNSSGIIYGMGSLWTSIIPSLVVEGIGESIAALKCAKVALLNCCYDRETLNMTGVDIIHALCTSLNRYGTLFHLPSTYITHLFVVQGATIVVDENQMRQLGIQVYYIPSDPFKHLFIENKIYPIYVIQELIQSIAQVLDLTTN
jgi:2-phospho-L-lactate transferase/gluconeogenesis factor (CofD/UPF0052 family)